MSRYEASQDIIQVVGPLRDSSSETDVASLIARILAGDREAFRPLVETHEPAVFGLCRRSLGGRVAEAEDLTQETFLRAFERLGELKDRERFAPWLYQIARSLCRDSKRRWIAERRALERRRLELERQAAEEDAGLAIEIDPVLDELPAEERRALALKYFEGLPYREIAKKMDLSFSQVDHLIRQARHRLGRRLDLRRKQRERDL